MFWSHPYGFVRQTEKFYVPGLFEMPTEVYWGFVSLWLFAVKAVFLRGYIEMNGFFLYIDMVMVAFYITTPLLKFQSQHWVEEKSLYRKNRIKELCNKAKLSEQEISILKPKLVDAVSKSQSKPGVWRITSWMIAIVIGSVISAQAGNVIHFLKDLNLLPFKNLLPPF